MLPSDNCATNFSENRHPILRAGGFGGWLRFLRRIEPGLGNYFLGSLYSDIDSLVKFAGIHVIHFGKYHRLLSKRFPFGIYYRMEENTAVVQAVLDLRRDPEWIRRRLR